MDNKGRWLEFRFLLNDLESDVLVALLSELPFNSFMEDDDALLAYLDRGDYNDGFISELNILAVTYNVPYKIEELPDKDWNEAWESNFDPVFIPGICTIVAPFHKDVEIDGLKITLAPKMAFGTGHHHTTHGMIVRMSKLELDGKEVMDFGSGTGLLAIFASMKGAENILAIDIEGPSYDNMIENFDLNNVTNATPIHGGKEKIPEESHFDIVLANITANVILDSLPELSASIKKGGTILFSGFYEKELGQIQSKGEESGLKYKEHIMDGEWVIATFIK